MKNKCPTPCLLLICATQALFAQTPEIGIRRSGAPPAPSREQLITQEQFDVARLQAVPVELRAIRQRQLEVAREQDVNLVFTDPGRVAQTGIRGTPVDLRSISITSEDQMSALIPTLYPLLGFSGAEQLIYSGRMGDTYRYTEQINGLAVEPTMLSIAVGRDQKILAIRGTAVIDRNFGSDHFLDAQSAIEAVNRHLAIAGWTPPLRPRSEPEAYLVYRYWDDYRTLAPWWLVENLHGGDYFVDPDGVVSSAVVVTP